MHYPFSHLIDLSGTPHIPTTEYCNIAVEGYPEVLSGYAENNKTILKRILDGRYDFEIGRKNGNYQIDTVYPQDSYGNNNPSQEKNGMLRTEELVTFSRLSPETGEFEYMTRSRPNMDGTNTPGKADPGVLSHGGLKQAGVVNAWRYVADKLGKNDNELSPEEYIEYLKKNPFPENYDIIDAGAFIIANGSNARNEQREVKGEKLEPRTSGLLNVKTVHIDSDDFGDILRNQEESIGDTIYNGVSLSSSTDTSDFTPKHLAVHSLLMQIRESLTGVL